MASKQYTNVEFLLKSNSKGGKGRSQLRKQEEEKVDMKQTRHISGLQTVEEC